MIVVPVYIMSPVNREDLVIGLGRILPPGGGGSFGDDSAFALLTVPELGEESITDEYGVESWGKIRMFSDGFKNYPPEMAIFFNLLPISKLLEKLGSGIRWVSPLSGETHEGLDLHDVANFFWEYSVIREMEKPVQNI